VRLLSGQGEWVLWLQTTVPVAPDSCMNNRTYRAINRFWVESGFCLSMANYRISVENQATFFFFQALEQILLNTESRT